MSRESLIVFSHLRWNFVFQRPQHLLTRLAREREVFFVEEPCFQVGSEPVLEVSMPAPGLHICVPLTPEPSPGFSRAQYSFLRPLLKDLVKEQELQNYCMWLYTPLALPLVEDLAPKALIYDCMDELSLFLNAPPELIHLEKELLERADIVFTGGPSLYRSKKGLNPNVHCFPSSVDAAHFGRAREAIEDPPAQSGVPRPRLGFFGVVDERIDIPIIDGLARFRPDWQVVIVGPIVKIDPASLPRLPNIHYLGQQPYSRLPDFLAGWDVCLLPFARNDATRFISPTKTLEYMAAEKPIVSTPIRDVADLYSRIVRLAENSEEFVNACSEALQESTDERRSRVTDMRDVIGSTSWDATADAMDRLIHEAVAREGKHPGGKGHLRGKDSPRPSGASLTPPANVGGAPKLSRTARAPRVIVAGAGPTGLSAAYHLGESALLIEQGDTVGGWCRSIEDRGFTFDHAGHIMFSNDPYVHELYKLLLGDNVHWQDREAWIFSKDVYTRYPFQGALHGLPADVVKECIVGAIEARFGPLREKPASSPIVQPVQPAPSSNGNGSSNGHGPASGNRRRLLLERPSCRPTSLDDCCGDGVLESTAVLARRASTSSDARNFEEFIYRVWGAGIAKHFAIPYNRKLWAVPLSEMETSWLGGRVPLPDLEEMIEGALRPIPRPMGPNARFGYPLRGGFQALMNGFLPHLKGELRLRTRVTGVSPSRRVVTLSDGTEASYDHLISTLPLPVLVKLTGDEAPPAVREAAAALRFVSVRCVNLGVARERITNKHWIYYPEDSIFHRIFVQGNASPHCNPAGGFGFTCEITYSPYKPLPRDGEALTEFCIEDCRRVGFIRPDDEVICANQADLPHAYVVYDHARPRNVARIREWLESSDILLAGRYSEWEYYNSDHAFLAGKRAAERVLEARGKPSLAREVPVPR